MAILAELKASRKTHATIRFVIGMDLLAQGCRLEAQTLFREAATMGGGTTTQAHWGQVFHELLSSDSTWPPWIQMREDNGAKNHIKPAAVNGSDE